ncbi:MAG: pantoate--beta-alanine ligase [Planktomarina sp.]
MLTFTSKTDARAYVKTLKSSGKRVGAVLTMGFLHEGHMSLIRRAKSKADAVVVSIFVNPTQFGEAADLDNYPRDTDRDLQMLQTEGVDAVFLPTPDVMYPGGPDTVVDVPSLSGILQGEVRPGHFQGVATVVTKLFNILQPDVTVFGEKDYQQLALIRKMVTDLDMPIDVIGEPIVREADGLAMSSRNVRLNADDRAAATVLNHALDMATACNGTIEDMSNLVTHTISTEPRATIKAIDIRDAATLAPVSGPQTTDVVVLLSVQFGDVLLIDNRVIPA